MPSMSRRWVHPVIPFFALPLTILEAASPATVAAAPQYFLIPLVGRLGREVPVEAFAAALKAADPTWYVVLEIDSPGGDAEEVDRFVRLLAANPALRTLALVQRADGTAASLPFACKWVFVRPQGRSSLLWPSEDGLTPEAAEQLLHRIRQRLLAACGISGRDSMPALAMVDPHLMLYGDGAGKTAHGPLDRDWRALKPQCQRLQISAANAVSTGYADGVCDSAEDIALKIGISHGWTSAGDAGRRMMTAAAENYRQSLTQSRYYIEHRAEIDALREEVRMLRRRIAAEPAGSKQSAEWQRDLNQRLLKLDEHETRMR